MDQMTTIRSREDRIRNLVDEFGLDELEAEFCIDLANGKSKGDIESDPPLTDEEREKLGLGRSLLDREPAGSSPERRAREVG